MRVVRFSCAHYRVPRSVFWPVPLEDRTLPIDTIELVTAQIETAEGLTGSGYTYTLGRGGAAVRAILEHEVGPTLLGLESASPAAVFDRLWTDLQRVGRGGVVSVALCAVDVALWDVAAKAAGLPLYRYLGATREAVPAYGSSIDLGYDLDLLLETVGTHLARGLGAVKIKVGRPLAEDLERLAAVRELLGPHRRLMVDANTGFDLGEATMRARAMEEFDLTWIEEPIDPDDVLGHAALAARTGTPIAAGETLFSVNEFVTYLRHQALSYVQADVARVGGITPWLRIASLAAASHLPMAPHFMQDIHVHLLCAISNGFILEHLPLLDSIVEEPLVVTVGGTVVPPERPGTGVTFSADIVAPHRVI